MNSLYKTPQRSAYIIIISLALFSAIYNAYIPLHGDEAYYWTWSRHLQSGYYDHPPVIAFFIHLTSYISDSEWGVRLVNVFSMSIGALYMFKLAKEMFDEKIALTSVIIFSSVILVHAGYIITTTDSPLILFWSMTLYYSYRAFFYEKLSDFFLAGLFLGLAMMSKYTAILFVFYLVLFALIKKRSLFLNKGFYLAALVAFIVVFPMVYWNYQHNWISFNFQLTYRGSHNGEIYPHLFFEFLGGQFGIFSPVFAAVLFYFLVKEKLFIKDDKLFFLALNTAIVLLFFLYKSFFTRMELNFGAPAYVAGAILTAYIFIHYKLTKTFKVGLTIAIIFTILGRIAFLFYLPVVQDRMYGNKQAVQRLQTYVRPGDALYGDHLTTAAYLEFYLKGHPHSDVILPSRFSQYDMWRKKDYKKDGLVLTRDKEKGALEKIYYNVKQIDSITVQKGLHGTKTLYIYRVANAK